MRHVVLVVLLVAALALPGFAAANAPLAFNLTFSGGTISGTFGGVPVQGTYSGNSSTGTWTLTVDGKVFATGTYTCASSGCTFTGTTLAGKSTTFTLASSSLSGPKTGNLTLSQFPNHGAWVSAVAKWANDNLEDGKRGTVVSEAAGGHGKGHSK